MFRKDPQIKALANLKSSERRRMLATVTELYGLPPNLTKDCEENVLPSIVKQTTFHTPKGLTGTVYTDDQQTPIWFKTKDSELIPSIYTMWKAPFLLPLVKTHPHVLEVLEGGADLMLPGTVPPFPQKAVQGAIVGVVSTHNPTVVRAIGRATMDLSGLERTIGTKGVAVEVYHTYEDMLFDLSKLKTRLPEELDMEMQFKPDEEEEATETTEDDVLTEATTENAEPVPEEVQEEKEADDVEEVTEAITALTTEDIDHFFKRSLLQTLTSVPPIELPSPASTFMNHIVNNMATDHSSVTIKKTSWKKSAKFLKAMEKEGLLKLKGKGDDITVVSAATKENNDELKNFVPYKVKTKSPTESKVKSKSGSNSSSLVLTKYYKATSNARMIFNDLDMDYMAFYTTNEVKDILNKYVAKHNLVNQKNKKTILLDDVLSSIIGGKENCIDRAKAVDPFIKKFTEHYKITNPSDPDAPENKLAPRRGQVPQVKIITETKIGRKLITRVSNFEAFGINPEELSSELKVKCSGSSTIGQNVQNPKLVEVTVQGPHSKIVIELLTKKYGLNSNWIVFEDKSRSKKK